MVIHCISTGTLSVRYHVKALSWTFCIEVSLCTWISITNVQYFQCARPPWMTFVRTVRQCAGTDPVFRHRTIVPPTISACRMMTLIARMDFANTHFSALPSILDARRMQLSYAWMGPVRCPMIFAPPYPVARKVNLISARISPANLRWICVLLQTGVPLRCPTDVRTKPVPWISIPVVPILH